MLQKQPPSVFYSYARADQMLFGMFVNGLRKFAEQKGTKLDDWYDEDIAKGRVWREEIATQIDNRQVMLVIVTATSVTREEVEKEARTALEQAKTVIPITFDPNVPLPDYLEAYQAIKAYEYTSHLDDLYAKVYESIMNPPPLKDGNKRTKYNLYIVTVGKHGGRTSLIAALSATVVDKYYFPGYFKPFQKRGEDPRDVQFLHSEFELEKINVTPSNLAPFEYAANMPACTETQLRDQFERVSLNRRPVMIEGVWAKPKHMTVRQMIVDVFDARLLLIFEHDTMRELSEPPAEFLQRVSVEMEDCPVAFVFNKVPAEGLDEYAREVRNIALDLGFKEVGQIPYDDRLAALTVRDIIEKTGAHLLTDAKEDHGEGLDSLVWRFGHTLFPEHDAIRFYQEQRNAAEHIGRAVFSGAGKLAVNLSLARLGYTLFLTGLEEPYVDSSVLDAAEENKKAILYFKCPTDEAIQRLNKAFNDGVPFCYRQKLPFLQEVTERLEKNIVEAVLKRN